MPPGLRRKNFDPLPQLSVSRRSGKKRTDDLKAQTRPSHAHRRVVLRGHGELLRDAASLAEPRPNPMLLGVASVAPTSAGMSSELGREDSPHVSRRSDVTVVMGRSHPSNCRTRPSIEPGNLSMIDDGSDVRETAGSIRDEI